MKYPAQIVAFYIEGAGASHFRKIQIKKSSQAF